jgi:uncharacterized protein (DUF58 family)
VFLGVLRYFFGIWAYAVFLLPVLMALLLTVALPNSARKKRIIRLVSNSVDVGSFFIERLDDHFDNLIKRLRRR